MHVQFDSADETRVIAQLFCEQDPTDFPHQGEVEETDPRWLAFQNRTNGVPDDAEAHRLQVEEERLKAYADPVTGSDRYFAEAVRLTAIKDTAGAAEARTKGLERYAQIQQDNPWPETDSTN